MWPSEGRHAGLNRIKGNRLQEATEVYMSSILELKHQNSLREPQ